MIEIIPSILATSREEYEKIVRKYEPFFERASVDISDGLLTPLRTINGIEELTTIPTSLKLDVHLMVNNPHEMIESWLQTSADRYFVHVENNEKILDHLISKIHYHGHKVGLVLNPDTGPETVFQFMDYIDYIQLMTVQPGVYGRTFMEGILDKISYFKDNYPNMPIAVDGGINADTISRVQSAGASMFIVGNYLLQSEDIETSLKNLKSKLI